ncbi:MAG: YihY/virulence factor BrkB family protein [Rhizobiales bacterium]|nr:YihY/virulence factor BrkB family protein [Hyphomicrobiales bacterium]
MTDERSPPQGSGAIAGLSPFRLLAKTFRRLFADEAVPLAGNIAFRTLFSIFPFLIFLTAIAGFIGTEDQARAAVNFLIDVVPDALVKPLAGEITSILTVPRADLLSIAALLTIWSAMAGVDSVRVGLNRAYDLKDRRPAWLVYLIDILFVIAAAALFVAFSFLIVLLPLALRFAAGHGIAIAGKFESLQQMRIPLALLVMFFGVMAAHVVLPARRMPLVRILPGVLLTVVVWGVLALGFSWWILQFHTFTSTYASLSGLFAAMFFLYLAALVLILGGEVNRVLHLLSVLKSVPDKPDLRE